MGCGLQVQRIVVPHNLRIRQPDCPNSGPRCHNRWRCKRPVNQIQPFLQLRCGLFLQEQRGLFKAWRAGGGGPGGAVGQVGRALHVVSIWSGIVSLRGKCQNAKPSAPGLSTAMHQLRIWSSRISALCGACWRDTPFATGLVCDLCGVPLPGEDTGKPEHCDDCLTIARPWQHGRAALMYRDNARKLVLALKHGDRLDLAPPAANGWSAWRDHCDSDSVIVPVPTHYLRFFGRRYNQAAVLAHAIGKQTGSPVLPGPADPNPPHQGAGRNERDQRFRNLSDAIVPESTRHDACGASRAADRRCHDLWRDVGRCDRRLPCRRCKPSLRAGTGTRCEGCLNPYSPRELGCPDMQTVEIYTSPLCGFCHAAKRLLTQKGVSSPRSTSRGSRTSVRK